MAKVHFPEDNLSIDVDDDTLIQDAIDKSGADVPFGCREGNCATCMIEVLDGMANLNGHTSQEEVTLLPDELEQNIRLACQCRVKSGEVSIKQADVAF